MSYVPENPEDVREHKKSHDEAINGFHAPPSKREQIIWSRDDMRITVINQHSPLFLRKRAEKVARLANRDTHYDFPCYSANEPLNGQNVHVFLLHRQNRVIGLLTMEKRDHIWQTSWTDLDAGKESEEVLAHPPMWSICFIWILQRHRGSHLGQSMINEAVAYLGGNFETIGWYTPFTDSGKALVRRCCPKVFYIAK
jgi:ribosomal protein S18 acetylase RimI-like enzyme